MTGGPTPTPRGYLLREAVLILLWAYVLLVGGTINGLIAFRVQALSAGLMTAAVGGWLAVRLLRRQRLALTGLEAMAAVFLAVQLGTALLSDDVRRSLPVVAQSTAYVLIFWCVFDLTRAGWPAELTEKTGLIVGGILLGLAGVDLAQRFLAWLPLVQATAVAPEFQYRLYTLLGDANLLSATVNILIPLAAARALATPRRGTRWLLGLWLVAALVVQAFTQSRGGLLGLAVALGTLAVLWVSVVSPRARDRALRLWQALPARPVLVAALGLVALVGLGIFAQRMLAFQGNATQARVADARSGFWEVATQAFARSPVWGIGPGLYPDAYLQARSIPPERPYLHAHSVVFTTLAEAGLVGLALVAAAVAAIALTLWRARHAPTLAARARWAAVAASWAGFLTHSQVDDHTRYLAVAVTLALLLGSALAEAQPPTASGRTWHPAWLAAPALAAGLITGYGLRAYAVSEQAADAAGDWARAAALFDQAAALDPALAFYWAQAGQAYGQLAATGDQAALSTAIDRLTQAQALEPHYALHPANLAVLYWQAGQRAEARMAMTEAVRLAPGEPLLQINLGRYAEAEGQTDQARAAYVTAMNIRPFLAETSFWAETPLRREALAVWRAAQPAPERNLADQTRLAIAAGEAAAAEAALLTVWRTDTQQPLVYVGLAELARARGDLAEAERQINNALWVQTLQIDQQVQAVLTAAEIAQAQGDLDAALARYENAWWAVSEYGSQGWGSAGWNPHAYFAFQRRALPVDWLPQLARPDLTPAMAARFLPLAELYAQRGDIEQARAVYTGLLARDGTLEAARAGLAQLPIP